VVVISWGQEPAGQQAGVAESDMVDGFFVLFGIWFGLVQNRFYEIDDPKEDFGFFWIDFV
jgi:hypothetical protein